MTTSTFVKATTKDYVCLPGQPWPSDQWAVHLPILGWYISDEREPVPLTPSGVIDISEPWIMLVKHLFLLMPDRRILNPKDAQKFLQGDPFARNYGEAA
jgi:hypothetical protein